VRRGRQKKSRVGKKRCRPISKRRGGGVRRVKHGGVFLLIVVPVEKEKFGEKRPVEGDKVPMEGEGRTKNPRTSA